MKASAGFTLGVLWLASAASAQCLKYPPDLATLTGVAELKISFGPPGYGEDPAHDSKEPQVLVKLDAPICIQRGTDKDGLEEPEANQRLVTLVSMSGSIKLRAFVGKRIRVRGTFFHAITGHHHTPLLLDVAKPSDVEVLSQ